MKRCAALLVISTMLAFESGTASSQPDVRTGLLGHWPLAGDTRDVSGNGRDAVNHGADLQTLGPDKKPGGATGFDGRKAFLEVPAGKAPALGKGEFTAAMWVHTERDIDDLPGDLLSQYDPARRKGFHLSLRSNTGVTFTQANFRHLHFGIDDNRESTWVDHGRPGKALLAFALIAHEGNLYAGTCEPGKNESGHVYRFGKDNEWVDLGAPDNSNAVTALCAFEGKLYAGTGKYRVAGSSLPESENVTFGGRIFRFDGPGKWADCGQLPNAESVGGMVVYRGRLHASSLYKPAGFFRYEGEQRWSDAGTPGGKRVEALGVYNGYLYSTGYDQGHVYRYDGKSWTDLGRLGDSTQTYSFAVYQGRLYVGTWPKAEVFRLKEPDQWENIGRLGKELEVMGMLVHNGRLMAGTLPLAEVYSFEGDGNWKRLTRLDHTPDVRYRRAWTAAEFGGRVFFSTLPSGKIFSFEAGSNVLWPQELPTGWQHVAAVRAKDRLKLHVNGRLVGESATFENADYDLSGERPLRIGFGSNDFFRGRMRDVRLYGRALSEDDIAALAK